MNEIFKSDDIITQDFDLKPQNNERLANLCGQFNEHLHQLEQRFNVEISNRGHQFRIMGYANAVHKVKSVLIQLYIATDTEHLTPKSVHLFAESSKIEHEKMADSQIVIHTKRGGQIRGRTPNQCRYLKNIMQYDINFGVGVAGSGKTYLSVACAVEALEQEQVRRLILVRPAVEAGERLGFLPGDLAQKVDPYLRPLYDALYEMLGFERVAKLTERNIIEIAPLAYMRGRSLNESFIILDEAQNTTVEQMKMFLTRIGFGSKAVITGDITQIDLPRERRSGLNHVIGVLKNVEEVSFTFFDANDVVRHPVVARIIKAYEIAEKNRNDSPNA